MQEANNNQGAKPEALSRRTFMARGALLGGALWAGSLQTFMGNRALGKVRGESPYGPIAPVRCEVTGLPLLQLPRGFRYISYGWTGTVMSDGVVTPRMHDGMAVIEELGRDKIDWHPRGQDGDHPGQGRGRGRGLDGEHPGRGRGRGRDKGNGRLVLVRNHEAAKGLPYTNDPEITFKQDGAGGTTNLIFDTRRGVFEEAWSSLAGTIRNCAGGVTPWGTWITCEETSRDAGHGYCFDVGPDVGDPTPLVDMGRFSHEAVAIDYKTGWVYETEDAGDCGFYRFVPNTPGVLKDGGKLYMMKVKGVDQADLGVAPVGTEWKVEWVRIDDPDATTKSTFAQGWEQGAARFSRLEGAWTGDSTIFFLSTDGGKAKEGQVFEYDPKEEKLYLIYESPGAAECENPDNITVTPRGGLLLCEDNAGPTTNDAERLLGLTFDGQVFTFAKNNVILENGQLPPVPGGDYRQNEWAGACYSPDGDWLFVNNQTPGITFAITGPWRKGPL